MTIEIRRVRPDELAESIEALTAAFLERPDIDAAVEQMRPRLDPDRAWIAHDGDRVCGTFRSWPTEITVPGGARLPAAAVSGVTVLPTHRRRGILRGMVAAEHAAIRERGEVMALLHAAEYPIYGRFGYGPGTLEATWTLDTRSAVVVRPATGPRRVRRPRAGQPDADPRRLRAVPRRAAGRDPPDGLPLGGRPRA